MPRNGSTLIEQMLISHDSFASLGEDASISNQVVAYIEQKLNPYPACLAELDQGLINHARNIYIERIKQAPVVPIYDQQTTRKLSISWLNIFIVSKR